MLVGSIKRLQMIDDFPEYRLVQYLRNGNHDSFFPFCWENILLDRSVKNCLEEYRQIVSKKACRWPSGCYHFCNILTACVGLQCHQYRTFRAGSLYYICCPRLEHCDRCCQKPESLWFFSATASARWLGEGSIKKTILYMSFVNAFPCSTPVSFQSASGRCFILSVHKFFALCISALAFF